MTLSVNGERLWSRLMEMAQVGAIPHDGSCRLALSDQDIAGRALFLNWCKARGYSYQYDKIGNMFMRREGRNRDALPIALGSHLDTQPNGGRFDGILGVLAAFEVFETLDEAGIVTEVPLEIVNWTNEEGSRFQPAMMGSGLHCGVLDEAAVMNTADTEGKTVGEEIVRHGYDKGLVTGAHKIARYIELHIEQGPILEAEDKAIGVVTGGQAIRWYRVAIKGGETHAGPMPMDMRRDPVPILARFIERAYQIGKVDKQSRCTVGVITTKPSSINVVPGEVSLTLDLRHPDDAQLTKMHEQLLKEAETICENGVEVDIEPIWHAPAVQFDADMAQTLRKAANRRGLAHIDMISGAGHDAFNLARIVPTQMIFVPCRDGISHNEAEYTSPEQTEAGANMLLDLVLGLQS